MVGQMIQLPSNARVSTTDVTNNPYFATGNLAVLRAIDTLAMRDVGTQGAQLLQLQHELTDFPLRLLQGVVLPTICNAANGNGALWVYVLTLLEVIAKRINNKTVFTSLTKVPLAKGLHLINPVETMQAFIRHLPFVMDTFDDVFFKVSTLSSLLPLFHISCLSCIITCTNLIIIIIIITITQGTYLRRSDRQQFRQEPCSVEDTIDMHSVW